MAVILPKAIRNLLPTQQDEVDDEPLYPPYGTPSTMLVQIDPGEAYGGMLGVGECDYEGSVGWEIEAIGAAEVVAQMFGPTDLREGWFVITFTPHFQAGTTWRESPVPSEDSVEYELHGVRPAYQHERIAGGAT